MGGAFVEYERGPLLVARWDRVIITVLRGQVDLPFMEAAQRLGRAMGARDPGRVASLTLASPAARPPEGAAREMSKKFTRESDAWIAARATVITAEGFAGSVARSVLTMITSFSRGPAQAVFAKADAAISWLGPRIDLPAASQKGLFEWCEAMLASDTLDGAAEASSSGPAAPP